MKKNKTNETVKKVINGKEFDIPCELRSANDQTLLNYFYFVILGAMRYEMENEDYTYSSYTIPSFGFTKKEVDMITWAQDQDFFIWCDDKNIDVMLWFKLDTNTKEITISAEW